MAIEFKYLFSPMTIRGHVYRNRIINVRLYLPSWFYFSLKLKKMFIGMVENHAKNDSSAVSTEEISVNAEEAHCLFLGHPIDPNFMKAKILKQLRNIRIKLKNMV